MSEQTTPRTPAPDREAAIPESYAVYVGDRSIDVWQYRLTVADPDGEWHFHERLDRENDPRLSLDFAQVTPPSPEGYWIYSKSYDCELDCE